MAAAIPSALAAARGIDEIYARLLGLLDGLGEYRVEEKKASLHIAAGRAAFLGVHPRKEGVRLNIVLARPLESPRLAKVEQVSKSRFHNEVDVRAADAVDGELRGWIAEAYQRVTA